MPTKKNPQRIELRGKTTRCIHPGCKIPTKSNSSRRTVHDNLYYGNIYGTLTKLNSTRAAGEIKKEAADEKDGETRAVNDIVLKRLETQYYNAVVTQQNLKYKKRIVALFQVDKTELISRK